VTGWSCTFTNPEAGKIKVDRLDNWCHEFGWVIYRLVALFGPVWFSLHDILEFDVSF
jgi:hypothetical protein